MAGRFPAGMRLAPRALPALAGSLARAVTASMAVAVAVALAAGALSSCSQLISVLPTTTTTTTTTVPVPGDGGLTLQGPPVHSVTLRVTGNIAGANPLPWADGAVSGSLSPAPPAAGVTYEWYLDGESARTNAGAVVAGSSSIVLGAGGAEVGIPEGSHLLTLKATVRGYSFTESVGLRTAAPGTRPPARKMAILMYHHVVPGVASGQYERSAADFENDLIYLRDHGFSVIGFEDMLDIQSGRVAAPAGKLVALTFDDGYRDMYTQAFPLLKRYGAKATFFIITGRVGVNDPPYGTWAQWREMAAWRTQAGDRLLAFGSHTKDHPFLHSSYPASYASRAAYLTFLEEQIGDSKAALEANIPAADRGPMFLSLPYGDGVGNTDITNVARRAGYRAIRTSDSFAYDIFSDANWRMPSLEIANNTAISSIESYY